MHSPDSRTHAERCAELFEEQRGHLFGVVYRMLGGVMDAEDVLQETYLSLEKQSPETLAAIRNPQAYLTSLAVRRAIDLLRKRKRERTSYFGEWLPEPAADERFADPAEEPERRESLSFAFLLLLEELRPAERAVYLLREVFNYEYPEIATLLGKRNDNCRQIYSRARQKMDTLRRNRTPLQSVLQHSSAGTESAPEAEEAGRLLEGFLAACRSGDAQQLEGLLAEDVRLHSDGGGKVAAAVNVLHGPQVVAKFVLGLVQKLPENLRFEFAGYNGMPAVIVRIGDALDQVSLFELDAPGEKIQAIYGVRNPDKLAALQS